MWTAVDHFKLGILGWVIGDHSAQTFEPLWHLVAQWNCYFYVTDGNRVYPLYAVEPLSTLLNSLSVPMETHYQRRRALHHVIWQLFEQGWSTAAIAQYVGMNIRIVQRDLFGDN